jgi:hypothetical protein
MADCVGILVSSVSPKPLTTFLPNVEGFKGISQIEQSLNYNSKAE